MMSLRRVSFGLLCCVLAGVSATLGGCACDACDASGSPPRPALISHPVFFRLSDPNDAPELIADCDRWIAPIPTVVVYACGEPFDSGRETVDSDYDVALIVGFDSPEGYAAYVEHPDHVRLVEKWGPRVRSLLVRDVIDPTP